VQHINRAATKIPEENIVLTDKSCNN